MTTLKTGDLLMDRDAKGNLLLGWVTIPQLKSSGVYSQYCQSEWNDGRDGLMKAMLSIKDTITFRNNYLRYRGASL